MEIKQIKYIGEKALSHLIEKCKATFASINHTHTVEEIGADAAGSASAALALAEQYTDEQIGTITTGNIVVKEATHATSADNATHSSTANEANHAVSADTATNATNAEHASSATTAETADEANHAMYADIATKDAEGNVITDTYETKTDAESKLLEAKAYADQIKSDIYGGVPSETLDTLTELATAFEENEEVVEALNAAITTKADVNHTHSWNDLEDRPFGELSSRTILLEDEYCYPTDTFQLKNNAKFLDKGLYIFTIINNNDRIDGIPATDYEVEISSDGTTFVFVNYISEIDEHTFSMAYYESDDSWHCSFAEKSTSSYLTIAKIETEIVPLDKKYIPDIYATTDNVEFAFNSANSYTDEHISEFEENLENGSIVVQNANYAIQAESAVKANADSEGNVITTTYETKADAAAKLNEINAGLSTKADLSSLEDYINENDGKILEKANANSESDSYYPINSSDLATKTYVDDCGTRPKTQLMLTDIANGYNYIIQVENGQLISYCAEVISMSVDSLPEKTDYTLGELFDPTGMILTVDCADGSSRKVVNYTYPETVTEPTVVITYGEYSVTIDVNIISMEDLLIDFYYTVNDDGTYTITAWKETLNGVPSTEMVVPNNKLIKI